MLIGGILEFFRANTFAFVVFGTYGTYLLHLRKLGRDRTESDQVDSFSHSALPWLLALAFWPISQTQKAS